MGIWGQEGTVYVYTKDQDDNAITLIWLQRGKLRLGCIKPQVWALSGAPDPAEFALETTEDDMIILLFTLWGF